MAAAGLTGETHPELFSSRPAKGCKPGQLSQQQVDEFYSKGYTLVKDFFRPEELQDVKDDIEVKVSELADRLYAAGKISDKCHGLGFYKRLSEIERQCPGANILLHKLPALPASFRRLAANERLLNLLEDFLGPDIAFNPVWNLRTKTPNNQATTVPWHQDSGYFDNDSYGMLIMTAWIPLIDADECNGTLQLLPRCHSRAEVLRHTCCAGPTWYIMLDEDEMRRSFGADVSADAEIVAVPQGSLLLFNNFTPHRSLGNSSDRVRWSLDFRWQRSGSPGCLFGLKKPCDLRRADRPQLAPDWDAFDAVDRNRLQNEAMHKGTEQFSTVIAGPWMHKWPIVHHNQHTEAFQQDPNAWDPNMLHG